MSERTESELADDFARLPALLADDADLIRRGAFFDARFQVHIGAIPFDVVMMAGRIAGFERGPFVMRTWSFAVRGTAEAWARHWKAVPDPGWHDIFAMTKRGVMTIEGDLHPLMANLQTIKDLLALPRQIGQDR
jgi:hypothetical protein